MAGSEREASVKLTLKSGSFLVSLKELASENEKAAKRTESAWKKAGVAGLKALRTELGETVSTVKSTIRLAASLGGAFTFGAAVKGALESQTQFRNLAFSVRAGTGELVKWDDLQRDAQTTAKQWGQRTLELGQAYKELFEETGDIGFAEAGMENAALAARATGESVASLASIAGVLNEKFDVTAEQLPETMAAVVSLGNKGGISVGQMGEKLGILGASAKAAGLSGQTGFQTIVGMANVADNAMGSFKKSLSAVSGLLDAFGTPEQAKKIGAAFQVVTRDAKGNARDFGSVMSAILKQTKGKKELLAKGFSGEQLKLVLELAKPFSEAFEQTTGTVKAKTAAGLAAYEAALKKAGQSQLTAAQLAEQANERVKDPSARLNVALEKMEDVFKRPAMINAIEKLSEKLPMVADKFAGLVDFVLDNPKTAAGIVLGFKLGSPMLSAAMQAAGPSIGKAIFGALGERTLGGTGAVGKAAGALGSVAAVAGAGFVGFEAGSALAEHVVDPAEKKSKAVANSLSDAMLAADLNTSGRFTKEGGAASLATLRERLDAVKKDKEFSASDIYTLGLRRLGTSSDEEVDKGEKLYAERKAQIDRLPEASGQVVDGFKEVTEAAKDMARALAASAGTQPGGGAPGSGAAYRGPPRASPAGPGYSR